ncbi:PBP1A family penicillin-binding protein [Paenibacillus sp.]|uniref:transglycosylase domain-containing protein n=1 Tax=Paenibacillus sp. TaxID=58172 RepID=UPI002D5CA2E6|nr:PBP1A family penicillin-binding protein [Paenibacillus sp.]HZG57529.1 PBP1A family penicillin-binding protein [Paenibacillus sp.]
MSRRKWLRIAARALLVAGLAAASLVLTAAAYVHSLDVSELGEPMAQPTRILDRDGEEIYKLTVRKFEPVSIDRMPAALLEAIVAIEDRRYYEHPGVDAASIARAVWVDLKEREFVEGASTITQQLAKRAFLTPEKSLERKLREAAYALKLEMTYDKDEVLERYLNSIYFGEGAYGVQAASLTYFGKDVSELTVPEAALLAGLPKAPSRYSPFDNLEGALERRNLVLQKMAEQGFLTDAELQEALASRPVLHDGAAADDASAAYASYVDAVIQEAIDRYGMTEQALLSGGYTIRTEMDRRMQEAAAEVFRDPAMFPASAGERGVESGAAFVDQATGGVRALMGSREEGPYRAFNRATQLKRQPGSAFKPIAAYGPALEEGYTPYSMLYDGPIDVNGYRPRNWDGRYHGDMTMAEAIRQSWNVPAVWLSDKIGVEKGIAFAERLGMPLTENDRGLGLALGGLSEGVSPLAMAQAFSAFANNGVLYEAHTIQSIESRDGRVVASFQAEPRQAMEANVAYTMTLLLQHAVAEGTGRAGAVPGWPTAGKTGTTQLPDTAEFAGVDGGAKDLWFAGYTPALTGAVWIGYDRTDRSHYMTTTSAAAAVFREIMTRALADETPRPFAAPPGFKADWDRDDRAGEERPKKKGKGRDKARERDDDEEEERRDRKGRGEGKGKNRE